MTSPLPNGGHDLKYVLPLLLLLGACGPLRDAAESLLDSRTPRERYEAALERAGLRHTALVREWLSAAERALRDAPLVASPHAEDGYLPPSEPAAIAYRVSLRRGQMLSFEVDFHGDSSTLLFLDAWQAQEEEQGTFRRIAVADSGELALTLSPRRDAEVILRVQPELLRGGRFTTRLRITPTLAFPVQNASERDIQSGFGAPRDGGSRSHHGIDIFAPRGTPALAAAEATVSRVSHTDIGGNVVWLRDRDGNRLYYAHLDRQYVAQGDRVMPGDTVGFVGNTGNARTTPPHLHFGIYQRGAGPVDPFWFVHSPQGAIPRLTADTTALGQWMRTARSRTPVLASPDSRADSLTVLPAETAVRVLAAVGSWYRVRLPDGIVGYLSARFAESASRPFRTAVLADGKNVLARPTLAPTPEEIIATIAAGESVAVIARFGGHALMRSPGGTIGWIELQ